LYIAFYAKPIADFLSATCHMGSHSVTCHLMLNLLTLDGWKAELVLVLVIYRGGLLVCKQSPVYVYSDLTGSETRDLLISSLTPCRCAIRLHRMKMFICCHCVAAVRCWVLILDLMTRGSHSRSRYELMKFTPRIGSTQPLKHPVLLLFLILALLY